MQLPQSQSNEGLPTVWEVFNEDEFLHIHETASTPTQSHLWKQHHKLTTKKYIWKEVYGFQL